jgi:DNA repair exonuclease SbcCD ATPase subunit
LNNYVTENGSLISALSAAESRLNEFFAEQSRWEMELAQRLDIIEKIREQVREIEREKRDLQRRYNEQVWSYHFEFDDLSTWLT